MLSHGAVFKLRGWQCSEIQHITTFLHLATLKRNKKMWNQLKDVLVSLQSAIISYSFIHWKFHNVSDDATRDKTRKLGVCMPSRSLTALTNRWAESEITIKWIKSHILKKLAQKSPTLWLWDWLRVNGVLMFRERGVPASARRGVWAKWRRGCCRLPPRLAWWELRGCGSRVWS